MSFNRRSFLKAGLLAGAGWLLSGPATKSRAFGTEKRLRMALLHLAAVPADVTGNRAMVESAIMLAAREGVDWILTPELCVCGYSFADAIGTDWITPQPGRWMRGIGRLAAREGVTVFLSHPERDPETNRLHNSVFVISPSGEVLGRHRKIRVLKAGAEAWSSPGENAVPVVAPPLGKVGILICADAYPPEIAKKMKAGGAEILVSSAAWNPGPYGPDGEWERCTLDTGLPMVVCNRTGKDRTLDFRNAESVVAWRGKDCTLSGRNARPFSSWTGRRKDRRPFACRDLSRS